MRKAWLIAVLLGSLASEASLIIPVGNHFTDLDTVKKHDVVRQGKVYTIIEAEWVSHSIQTNGNNRGVSVNEYILLDCYGNTYTAMRTSISHWGYETGSSKPRDFKEYITEHEPSDWISFDKSDDKYAFCETLVEVGIVQ